MIGFICGRTINIMLNNKQVQSAEINFLCLDKRIRNNKLCPLLINEITKRFNEIGIYEAIYTSEHLYNNILTNVSYYIRFLNIKKLIDIKYIKTTAPINKLTHIYKLEPIKYKLKLIKLTSYNCSLYLNKCFALYNEYYKKFDCYDVYDIDTFEKIFISNNIDTYLLIDNNILLDFISYYTIDITVVLKNINTKDGYMYYYTNSSNNLKIMIELLLPILKDNSIDTFKALNIMDNTPEIFNDLKFINDNGDFNYYLYKDSSGITINNKTFAKILF